ncbi:MAG: GDP-mannose 4,6-dehydratase [Acidobacteriota bacterium]|jgi:UDP-glucuronate 4-epimerase
MSAGRHVLLTGGAGFIGSHLTRALLARGDRVTCLDLFDGFYDPSVKRRNVRPFLDNGDYRLVEGDIRDEDALERTFRSGRFDAMVHLAARAGVRPSIAEPALYQDVNVRGTVALLEACRRHEVRKVLFGSSSSVYGNNDKTPFHEDDPVDRPISPYAATKRAGELLCFTYHHLFALDVFCLRFFTVYGPSQRPEMAIHRFVRQIDAGEPLTMFGDGSTRRDYTYVDDIVRGVLAALDRVEGFRIYNLGESRTVSLAELVAALGQAVGTEPRIERRPDQPGDVRVTYADISRAREELGYAPRVDLEEGLRRFVAWYREHR